MIYLKPEDIEYLLEKIELSVELRSALEALSGVGGKVSTNQADELRDLCNDRVDLCGYDENYTLNDDGKILDALVDKLYVG